MRAFRLLACDLPGHGESADANHPATLEALADTLLRLMDSLGIDEASLVGISIGRMIAQAAALKAPARITRLVLANTSAAMPPAPRTADFRATSVAGNVLSSRAIADLDHIERLSDITSPYSCHWCSEDIGVPLPALKLLQDGIRGSELLVLQGAGHLSNIDLMKASLRRPGRFLLQRCGLTLAVEGGGKTADARLRHKDPA